MILIIILAFTVIPVLELVLLFTLTHFSNWSFTIGLIILTGLIGSFLAKRQGWQAWANIRQALAQGRLPGNELMHGFLILIAGALLITPGILTDISGFLLLLPAFRELLGKQIMKKLKAKLASSSGVYHFSMGSTQGAASGEQKPADDPDIIDVEGKVVDDQSNRR